MAARPSDLAELMAAAACFTCFGPQEQLAVQTYILYRLSGMSTTPQQLMTAATCFMCFTPGQLSAITVYLLFALFTGGGGTPSPLMQVFCTDINSTPTVVPTSTCAICYGTGAAQGSLWTWNGTGWDQTIAA